MRRILATCAALVWLSGCSSDAPQTTRTPVDQMLFGPVNMRLHPVFTQVRDWTGDNDSDGIEAVIELQDQFGDPTKASGRVIFELFTYRPYNPDVRGQRIVAPWEGRLDSMEDQRSRWNRVNRAYIFQLAYPQVNPRMDYVLVATFEFASGGRKSSSVILEGRRESAPSSPPPAIVPTPVPEQDAPGPITPAPAVPPAAPSTLPAPEQPTPDPDVAPPTTANQPPARADQP